MLAISDVAFAHNGTNHQVATSIEDEGLNNALEWLESAQREDGRVVGATEITTDFQSTAAALSVYNKLDSSVANKQAALSFMLNIAQTMTSTELSNILVAQVENNAVFDDILEEILKRRNSDGGFGEFADYDSTPLNTALALIALQKSGNDFLVSGAALNYLINHQMLDGGFPTYGENSSIFVTALVILAVKNYLYSANVSNMLERAVEYLYSYQTEAGNWGGYWETAFILGALIPVTTDISRYQDAIDYLKNGQSKTNGSWEDSVYTTALSTSALLMYSSITFPTDPNTALLTGRAVDSHSGLPLRNLNIDVIGVSEGVVEIREDGSFVISQLVAGTYTLNFFAPGYLSDVRTISLKKGQFINLGLMQFTVIPTAVLLEGQITNALDNQAIVGANVSVSVDNQVSSTLSDAEGYYQILVEDGTAQIIVSAQSFQLLSASAEFVTGQSIDFSPALTPSTETLPNSTSIRGNIIDAEGNEVIGASVTIVGGAEVLTNGEGRFQLLDIAPGQWDLEVSKSGSETVTISAFIPQNVIIELGDIVLREKVILPYTSVSGRVVDMMNGQGIPGATVNINGSTVTTDFNGYYQISGISVLEFTIAVEATGYLFSGKQVLIAEHSILNMDVELRQANLGSVNMLNVLTDKSTYRAYEYATISASLVNGTLLTQSVFLHVSVKNELGEEIANFPAQFLPPLDPQSSAEEVAHFQLHLEETIEHFAPGEQRVIELEQQWFTGALVPGNYTVSVQALDSATNNLVAEKSTLISIAPTKLLSLHSKVSPGYALLNNPAEISPVVEVLNRSNVKASISFNYQLLNPEHQALLQGTKQFELQPSEVNQSIDLPALNQLFTDSGHYLLSITDVVGGEVKNLSEGTLFVPPFIRLKATQSLTPLEVVPLEGVPVESRIELEGVDGE